MKLMNLLLLSSLVALAACSSDEQITYNIKKDKETGILYNTDWDEHLDAKNAYYNNTNGLINVRSGPAETHKVIAYAKPREGGFIENCNFDLQFCFINFGGKPESGWVNMDYLKEGKIEYKK